MGRKIRRVPEGFDWPLNEPWEGFLNPYSRHRGECQSCGGSGYSSEAKRFADEWHGYAPFDPAAYGATPLAIDSPAVRAFAERNVDRSPDFYARASGYAAARAGISDADLDGRRRFAVQQEIVRLFGHWKGQWCHHLIRADVDALIAGGRLTDLTHRWSPGEGWVPIEPAPVVTADQVNEWSLSGMGHDCINRWICVEARCAREGVAKACAECDGGGERWPTAAHKSLHDAWREIPPPTGDGWQLWQDTSEDSPISPVFAGAEELAAWAADNATTFGGNRESASRWLEMIREDYVRHEQGNMVLI